MTIYSRSLALVSIQDISVMWYSTVVVEGHYGYVLSYGVNLF